MRDALSQTNQNDASITQLKTAVQRQHHELTQLQQTVTEQSSHIHTSVQSAVSTVHKDLLDQLALQFGWLFSVHLLFLSVPCPVVCGSGPPSLPDRDDGYVTRSVFSYFSAESLGCDSCDLRDGSAQPSAGSVWSFPHSHFTCTPFRIGEVTPFMHRSLWNF